MCRKRFTPRLDLSDRVVGSHRVGIGLMSLVAYLAIKGRMTKRSIQSFVKAMHGVHLGLGEITKILHTVARRGREEKEKRKVCGGTRSQRGSETKMTLMSLFGTWAIRELDAMAACRQLLLGKSVLFPKAT